MSQTETIARPYAKAVFEQAVETESVANWIDFLEIASAFVSNEAVKEHLASASFMENFLVWFEQFLVESRGEALSEQERNFLNVLNQQGRMAIVSEIATQFKQLYYSAQNVCKATVYTALALDEKQKKELQATIERNVHREVVLDVREEPALIAGVRIEYDGMVIDQSARGRLERFARMLDESRN